MIISPILQLISGKNIFSLLNLLQTFSINLTTNLYSYHQQIKLKYYLAFLLLKTTKVVDLSAFLFEFSQLIKHDISEPLSQIINLSFSTGCFPNNLKIAKVIPVFKKDSPLECNNYRPISLLSNIDKIFEKNYVFMCHQIP